MSGSVLVVTFDTATGIRTGRLIGSTLLEDYAVASGKIASAAVVTVNIADLNVTSAKLTATLIGSIEAGVADEGVTSAKLASGAVIGDRIAIGGITSGHIASGIVGTVHLRDAAVVSAKLISSIIGLLGTVADEAITSAKLASGAVGGDRIWYGAIISGHVASGIVGGVHLVDATITSAKVASGIVGGALLQDLGVLSAKIASGIIGGVHIQNLGILSGKYASGSITEQALVSGISIDIAETTQDPTYRAKQLISATYCVFVAPVSGNYVDIALAISGYMPAIGLAGQNIDSGQLGTILYGGRATAPADIVSGRYGRQVFVGMSGQLAVVSGEVPALSGYCQQIMGAVRDNDEIFLFPEPGYIELT